MLEFLRRWRRRPAPAPARAPPDAFAHDPEAAARHQRHLDETERKQAEMEASLAALGRHTDLIQRRFSKEARRGRTA